jgi:hypothetical protein
VSQKVWRPHECEHDLTANQAYALTGNLWLTPTSISNPRLMKISVTLDLK